MSAQRELLIDEARSQIEALLSYRRRAFCAQPLTRDVSLPQLHILMRLAELGPTSVSELAHSMSISTPSASSILDRIEEHGLVERVRDVVDRRVVHVLITERGRTVVNEFGGPKREQLQHLLGSMTEEELQSVVRAVEAVRRVVEGSGAPRERDEIEAAS
ncbi:MAG TPA: MarR family transcriptional regulator [Chloroflexota bacterium]